MITDHGFATPGSRSAFAELDTAVQGTIHFGDDSVTEIEGRGTVELLYKDGEHRAFAGVLHPQADGEHR